MNLHNPSLQKTLACVLLVVALVFLAVGAKREHKIYDAEVEEFGLLAFIKISDRALTIDTTFGGVTRKNGRLYSTYDRAAPRGKKACPT